MKTAFPVDKFDLKGLIQNTLEYCKQNVSEGIEPSSAIVIFKGYSKPPKQIDDRNRDLEKEIIQDGNYVATVLKPIFDDIWRAGGGVLKKH